jgi:hypothetical protein
MRWSLVACVLAGCGRLQFDGVAPDGASDGGAASDTTTDTSTVPLTCMATPVSGVDYGSVGTATTRVIAAQVPDGFAMGLLMDGYSPLWGVHLDSQLVPDTTTPIKTTPAGSAGYVEGSMFWSGTALTGTLDNGDGTIYLKTFAADMSTFNSADLRTGSLGHPSVASTGGAVISFWHSGANLNFNVLQMNGQPSGTDNQVGPFNANVAATSATSGTGEVAVAVALTNQTCELVTVKTALTTEVTALTDVCANPSIIASGAGYTVAYESGANIVVVTTGMSPMPLGAGSSPRVFVRGGEVLVAYRSGAALKVVRAADGTPASMTGLPSTIDAFDVAGPQIFAVTGVTAHAVDCP